LKTKPVVPRAQANLDVDTAIDFYLQENALGAANGFIDALEQAYTHIGRHASTGSPQFGHELELPGLRA
jgi:toxin ParE1/3/4